MRIIDYPSVSNLEDEDSFIVQTGGGTRKVESQALADEILAKAEIIQADDPVVSHRVYRGKNLGTAYTDEQKQAIQNGTFEDLYVGDYWVINGHNWRIMDIDYFYKSWYTAFTSYIGCASHHVVVMPDDDILIAYAFNGTNGRNDDEWASGYPGTLLYRTDNGICKNIFAQAFGEDALKLFRLTHHTGFSKTTGKFTAQAKLDTMCMSPKASFIYGGYALPYMNEYTSFTNPNHPTRWCGQFAAFTQNPQLIVLPKNKTNSSGGNVIQYFTCEMSSLMGASLLIGMEKSVEYGHNSSAAYRPLACIG